jgi:hypothetical protein
MFSSHAVTARCVSSILCVALQPDLRVCELQISRVAAAHCGDHAHYCGDHVHCGDDAHFESVDAHCGGDAHFASVDAHCARDAALSCRRSQ